VCASTTAFLECHQPTPVLGECQLPGIGATGLPFLRRYTDVRSMESGERIGHRIAISAPS
jgi:hypothetical protein